MPHALRNLHGSMVYCGWRLQFGPPDYLTCQYWFVPARDLLACNRARGFPPVPVFEDVVSNAESMRTYGAPKDNFSFVETPIRRNIRFDRILNFAGAYDESGGDFKPDEIVPAEVMLFVRDLLMQNELEITVLRERSDRLTRRALYYD